MNLLLEYQNKFLNFLKKLKNDKIIYFPDSIKGLTVELTPKNKNADISCNMAMILVKFNDKTSIEIANILKKNISENFQEFEKIEVAKPGFININFTLDFWKNYLLQIIKYNLKYGSNKNLRKKYNVEFVSANPTGPLHVGHCRGAVLGDAISNLLKFNGHFVTKEYYVNDYGSQVRSFVVSVYYRILEITEKKKFPTGKDLYPGDYIIDIAKKIINEKKIKDYSNFDKIYKKLLELSLKFSILIIKNNLNILGIKHDIFTYESDLIKKKLVIKTVEQLKKNKHIYKGKLQQPKGEPTNDWKKRNQLLFNSTKFGDDMDRSLQKEDKTWTYFAGDIAYHAHKIDRNFDVLINILGADHSGYVKRIKAAVSAISENKANFVCKISQLVKLFKKGKPFKMSKREGNYITVEDLINEVGKDSVRFMMLNRSNDVELEFDFEKVTEKSKDNPVFYVQYAYARINSIFRTLNLNIDSDIDLDNHEFNFGTHEIEILKKIAEWPKCMEISSNKLEPHRIPYFLYDLATLFHSYWHLGKDDKKFRFIQEHAKTDSFKLLLLKAMAIVIKNGMSILGVSTPKKM